MAHLADYSTDNKYRATVKSTQRLTPAEADEIREIVLEVEPGFKCEIDQGFGVLVEAKGDFGNHLHHRMYSVADLPKKEGPNPLITMLVKRCEYVDEFSGERYPGVASNYLCDRKAGDQITITGPHGLPFEVPEDHDTNLILVGMGTGIAPFRAFIKHIYKEVKDWRGEIMLFYGARSGLETLYLNDKDGDLTQYYDEDTFKAFKALSPRPEWEDAILLDAVMEERADEILALLSQSNTRIYVAGYAQVGEMLDKAFSVILGSEEKWALRKAELKAGNKWAEVIY